MKLRESIPAHVKPTEQWLAFNQRIVQGEASLARLNEPHFYDPEIVFFADQLDRYTDKPEFSMIAPDGTTFVTRFSSTELNYVTRWILITAINRLRHSPCLQPVDLKDSWQHNAMAP